MVLEDAMLRAEWVHLCDFDDSETYCICVWQRSMTMEAKYDADDHFSNHENVVTTVTNVMT